MHIRRHSNQHNIFYNLFRPIQPIYNHRYTFMTSTETMSCQLSPAEKEILRQADMKFFAEIKTLMTSAPATATDSTHTSENVSNRARGTSGSMQPVCRSGFSDKIPGEVDGD